jgi:16S rRNA G527 N7-methylase RsmG
VASSILLQLSEPIDSMEAALAELSIEDVNDEADDRDFIIARGEYSLHIPYTLSLQIVADEEDVFESDFENTDEEAETAQQTADARERQVRAEERKEKKVEFPKFFQLIDLPSNAGCAEQG